MADRLIDQAELARQSYGIATAQTKFGGPVGIWLECSCCGRSDVIVGSNSSEWAKRPDRDAAEFFRANGWAGRGTRMLKAKCPDCSKKAKK